MKPQIQAIARNRRARHEYELLETFEAGLELLGTEVKSLRAGKAQITKAYVRIQDDQAWLVDAHIDPYSHATHDNHEPERARRLLLKRSEIAKLRRATQEKGLTLVPLQLYFKGPWAKLELALGRGKKLHDKRESLRERQDQREADRDRRR